MTDIDLPVPEPTELDEQRARELANLARDSVLRAKPYGDEKCGNCLFFLDTGDDPSYCWHPKLRILVGDEWWCQWWEAVPASA